MLIRYILFIFLPSFFITLFYNKSYSQDISNIEKKNITKDTLVILEMHKKVSKLWHTHPDSLISVGYYIYNSSKNIDYSKGVVLGLLARGTGYYQIGKNKEAVETLQKIIDQKDMIFDKANLIRALSNQSMAYSAMGMYDHSIENLLNASRLCKTIGAKSQMLQILNNLGMTYDYKGNYDKAIQYYEQCKKEMLIQKDSTNLSFIYCNIANILVTRGEYHKAKEYYRRGLSLAKHFENQKALGYTLKSLGTLALEQKKTKEALNYFLEAKIIFEKSGEQTEYLPLLVYLSNSYFELKLESIALDYLKQAYKLAQEQQHLYHIKNISLELSKYFEKTGNLKDALAMQKIANNATDSLVNSDAENKIIRLEERYQFEKEIERTKLDYEKAIDRKENIIILIVIITFFILSIVFILYKAFQKQKLNNKLLKDAKDDIVQKNALLIKEDIFKEHMLSVLAHDVRSPIVAIRALLENFDNFSIDQKQFDELLIVSCKEMAHLNDFIDDILLWVKTRKSDYTKNLVRFNLTDLVNNTTKHYELQAQLKNITFKLDYSGHLYALGDTTIYKIIVRNLIDNAIKYSNKNTFIKIKIEEDPITEKYKLTISDSGQGINPSVLKNINERLMSEEPNHNTMPGSGLGFNIISYYSQLIDSKIELVSEEGVGTHFSISIDKYNDLKNYGPSGV